MERSLFLRKAINNKKVMVEKTFGFYPHELKIVIGTLMLQQLAGGS